MNALSFLNFRPTKHHILVAGSYSGRALSLRESYQEICRSIGRRLGRRSDVNILVCGLHSECADYYVVEGALSVRDTNSTTQEYASITLFKTEGDKTEQAGDPLYIRFSELGPERGCFTKSFKKDVGRWDGAFLAVSKLADSLIVVGGEQNTRDLIDFAVRRDACILGVKFGHGQGDVKYDENFNVFKYFGLQDTELLEFLGERIISNSDDNLFNSIVKATKRNPWSKGGMASYYILACALIMVATLMWFFVFLLPFNLNILIQKYVTSSGIEQSYILGARLYILCVSASYIGCLLGCILRVNLPAAAIRRVLFSCLPQAAIFGTLGFSTILISSQVVLADLLGAGAVTSTNLFKSVADMPFTFLFGSVFSAILGYGGLALVLSLVRMYRPRIS